MVKVSGHATNRRDVAAGEGEQRTVWPSTRRGNRQPSRRHPSWQLERARIDGYHPLKVTVMLLTIDRARAVIHLHTCTLGVLTVREP